MPQNWFIQQEAKWRSAASAVWAFLLTLCVVSVFLLVWIFSPLHHVINICNYFFLLITFRAWFVITCISLLSALFIKIHFENYSVICDLQCSRLELLLNYFNPRNWFYALCTAGLCIFIAILITNFATNTYSIFSACVSSHGTFRCLNEAYFVLLMFAFFLGFAHYLSSKVNHFYTLRFPFDQQARLMLFKVSFIRKVTASAEQSFNFLKYFVVFYYILGVFPRYFISLISDYPFCDADLIGFNNFTSFVSVAWTLWIFGTLLLFLIHITWHLFNSYNTKDFNFPVDSVFPEDDCRMLAKNLNKSQPLLVQHLAFLYLSRISKYSIARRKQLFVMKFEKQGGRLLKWNVVADECLARIRELTNNLKAYHQSLSDSKTDTSSSDPPRMTSSHPGDASTSMLRRRPLSDATNTSQQNTTYFELSPHNATTDLNASRRLDQSVFHDNSIVVPTPKLWGKQQKRLELMAGIGDMLQLNEANKMEKRRKQGLFGKFRDVLKRIPIIAYFVKKIPDREVANIFSNHYIYQWAVESLSLLVAASLTEDDYGFVQQRISEVLVALLDLLAVLEKNSKLPFTATSPSSAFLLRQQHKIKVETKAAVYRISNTFSNYMDTISLKGEHQRRLNGFLQQKE